MRALVNQSITAVSIETHRARTQQYLGVSANAGKKIEQAMGKIYAACSEFLFGFIAPTSRRQRLTREINQRGKIDCGQRLQASNNIDLLMQQLARNDRIAAQYPKPVTLLKQVIAKMASNESSATGNQNIG
jgi:hypothetical protein